MNVKYLSGFKWADLTEQIARENDIRQSKLQLEISQANKLNAEFIRNVEKSKMINKIKSKKRGSKAAEENPDIYRTFKQRKVTTSRADGPEAVSYTHLDVYKRQFQVGSMMWIQRLQMFPMRISSQMENPSLGESHYETICLFEVFL